MKILILLAVLMPGFLPLQQTTTQPATAAPPFALKDLQGRNQQLSGYQGKVVLINFWATWCTPCLAEMPELVKWQKEYKERDLQIIGITHAPYRRSQVNALSKRLKINYPLLYGTRETAAAYGVSEMLPVTIIIDREGKIRERILGIIDQQEFDEKIKPLLQ